MWIKTNGQIENDILLVINQNESVPLVMIEFNSFQYICIVIERFFAKAEFRLALDEVRD